MDAIIIHTQLLTKLYPGVEPLVATLVSTVSQCCGVADLRRLKKLCERLSPSIHNGRLTNIDDSLLEVSWKKLVVVVLSNFVLAIKISVSGLYWWSPLT